MQQVNDDMDELYSKAAENYPLNTNTADWEKLRKKLAGIPGEPVITTTEKKNNYRTLLLLVLLIPAGLIGYRYFSGSNVNGEKTMSATGQNNGNKVPGAADVKIPGNQADTKSPYPTLAAPASTVNVVDQL